MRARLVRTLVLASVLLACLGAAAPQASAIATMPAFCGPECSPNRCETDLQITGMYVAGYACNTMVNSLGYFKGWATVRTSWCQRLMVAAWRWNGSWSKQRLAGGTNVYVWPFATDWSWVWTQQTGWLAMRDLNLVVNKWTDPLGPFPMCMPMDTPTYVD